MRRGDGTGSGSRHRYLISTLIASGTALALAGCASFGATDSTSDATPAAGSVQHTGSAADQGCTDALHVVSTYGPSTVKLLAEGRETLNKAAVQLVVDGLDGAADAANSAQAKQDIKTLADAYDDYFNVSTDATSIPLSTLLKDTADVEFICR